jgi:hypothetical protein
MTAISVADPRHWKIGHRRRAGWNRIPAAIHDQIIELALEQSELSPRDLAIQFTDEKSYFVSEASVYRLLKATASSPARPMW